VEVSARDAAEYLRRIKREAEEAESLRRALEEEREAVAEKYASLDAQAMRRERERQAEFETQLLATIEDFEKRSRELVSSIEDRTERARVEREAQKRAAELRREAKRAAHAAAASTSRSGQPKTEPRGVRVLRDGHEVNLGQSHEADEMPAASYVAAAARPIVVGDRVRLRSFGSEGVVDKLNGDEAEVRVKALRFREKVANLELLEPIAAAQPDAGRRSRLQRTSRGTEVRLRAPDVEPRAELNVIGRTTDEAVDEADKFLDEAFMNNLNHVRIVHGHGTGALRRAISNLLKDHPHVARFAQAPQDQGGAGATLIELRQ
jgi:DNA mismatch repair protein MutS2